MWFMKNSKRIGLVTRVENIDGSEYKSNLDIIIYDSATKTMRTISSVYSYDSDFSIGDCIRYDEEKATISKNNSYSDKDIDGLNNLINLYRKQTINNHGSIIAEDDKMLVSAARFKYIMEQNISSESLEGLTVSQIHDINVLIPEYKDPNKLF